MPSFWDEAHKTIERTIRRPISDYECKAVLHHLEYRIRANNKLANFGELKISTQNYEQEMLRRIKMDLHANDLPRYCDEYRDYKLMQKNSLLTTQDLAIIQAIASKQKNVSDFDTDKLQTIYTKYIQQRLMPQINNVSNQHNLDYHGLWHTRQVAAQGLYYALNLKKNPLPVIVAAGLHDCARTTDRYEPHGEKCRPIAEKFLNESYNDKNLLSKEEKQAIIGAIIKHDNSRKYPIAQNYVEACLWDADRTRLAWERGYHEDMFNTSIGKKVAKQYDRVFNRKMIEQMRALDTRNNNPRINTRGNSASL